MTFFKELNTLLNQASLNITVAKKEGNLTVSVTPIAPEGVKIELKPLLFNGTPEELDAKFIETLKSPLAKTETAFSNAAEFEKQLEEKKEEVKTKKETKAKEPKKEEKKETTKADVIMGKKHPEPTLFEVPETPIANLQPVELNKESIEPEPESEKVEQVEEIPNAEPIKEDTKHSDPILDLF